ncbi:Elongation factor 4 [Entomobacter blattae]|uniref:Translation initiation factor IF-2 n=1 Tax=Entomobacter blattae TaxID=2762277 RepID=A0A7H1NPJ8_9PROT|nr:translation initiation factor IF-2 [Entomobacter blattae]QNT77708.1 Elongation factor 4 [Entomobacter blattae]
MSESKDQEKAKGRLSLRPTTLEGREAGHTVDAGSVRQSFSHGRSKVVQVEVRKKRSVPPAAAGGRRLSALSKNNGKARALTAEELATRQRVLEEQKEAQKRAEERLEQEKISILSAAEEERKREKEQSALSKEEVFSSASSVEEETSPSIAAKAVSEKKDLSEKMSEGVSKDLSTDEGESSAQPGEESQFSENDEGAKLGEITLAPRPKRLRPLAERAIMPATPSVIQADKNAVKARSKSQPMENDGGESASTKVRAHAETLRMKAPKNQDFDEEGRGSLRKAGGAPAKKSNGSRRSGEGKRLGRIDVQAAIDGDDDKTRSLASVRRQRERERRQAELERLRSDQVRVVREVVLPETITVQELANRMAARQGEVIKALMKMGVMATGPQIIDADTAELVVEEFGHRVRRVAESDVEIGIEGIEDTPDQLKKRPPVITIMGHVDHGKTSLLDALRTTDVVAGEAGGITQHIGAYQVTMENGEKITFLDTPGHEAFTSMRIRGASVTDIVVLVVAADDGVMPQTVEAIKHAKAANAPIIVAINKCDKPDAKPDRVRQELLNYEIVVEAMGGDTQDVEISAKKRVGLKELEEAILLQAEILDLKANPNRVAEGTVIESRLDRGRGPVATVLVQKGTLHQGEIVVAGTEWGRVRAMLDDKGRQQKLAGPSVPVELLGITGVPSAGEPFVVVENETRAREISEFRQRKKKEKLAAQQTAARGTMDQMFARIQAGEQKEVVVLIKADVQGSAEAIQATVLKLEHAEVKLRVVNSAVGQITESDVQLAKASDSIIIAFNVRATSQARELADAEGVDIRYYSVIYQVADDIEQLIKGKVAPKHREKFLGYAEIRKVFEISKIGKVAGCFVTEGVVKRGCGVRLLRDNVVIHEGELSQLKRFKDDVREVNRGYECGLSFTGYNDIREGDVVECYEMEVIPA